MMSKKKVASLDIDEEAGVMRLFIDDELINEESVDFLDIEDPYDYAQAFIRRSMIPFRVRRFVAALKASESARE